MITRRKLLISFAAGALAASFRSFAQQQAGRAVRIGYLGATSAFGTPGRVEALRAGLRDLGYVEGKNLVMDFRWAEGKAERLPELAAELVRLQVDVLVTNGAPATRAARQASATIPIVMASSGDAVAAGLVASLARPGGNVTGTTFFSLEIFEKRLDLLKQTLPRTRRVAFLANPDLPTFAANIAVNERAAKLLGLEMQPVALRGPAEFDAAFSAMMKKRVDAISVQDDAIFVANAKAIADLAAKHRLSSIGGQDFALAGGLIGYGADLNALSRRGAYFVDKIVKGAKPTDLPVERPTKFEFLINRKTAKALGVRIAQADLVRADRVIE